MSERTWHKTYDRNSDEYMNGIFEFITAALRHRRASDGYVLCPCRDCLNLKWHEIHVVATHLLKRGMAFSYTTWVYHGEKFSGGMWWNQAHSGHCVEVPQTENDDEPVESIGLGDNATPDEGGQFDEDIAMNILDDLFDDEEDEGMEGEDVDADKWASLFADAEQEVYPGCKKFSLLSAVIELMHIKVTGRQTESCFNAWLNFLKRILPEGERLSSTYYEARRMLKALGMDAILIHACVNNCVLFQKEFRGLDKCPRCNESRWKLGKKGRKIPAKVLRYFPLKPRLQRLFRCKETAANMKWHKHEHKKLANVLSHPSDSDAWEDVDRKYPAFGVEARNVRLGLATDGFNPFGQLSVSYSCWPVMLFVYNVPPWKCMKEPYIFLSLLIPGPKSPGKDIDVFLRPLIDELKELWNVGVQTFDVESGRSFRMHDVLLWTIHDFPAYGDLSGWTTKGYKACPVCNIDTDSGHSQNKFHYMGHRRFLPENHQWRRQRSKFDGTVEKRGPPRKFTNEEIIAQLSEFEHVILGKKIASLLGESSSSKRKQRDCPNWCKKSILFELPYWGKLRLRHNLDVMHIEKNICDNIVVTILNIKGRTKDTEKARKTLEEMKIRPELHLIEQPSKQKLDKPSAKYALPRSEVRRFCALMKDVRLPDGYASNISKCFEPEGHTVVKGLKSHDCHVLIQRILPIVLRGFLPDGIYGPLREISRFFRELCAKELRVADLKALEQSIIRTLCKFEMIFPPAFFDVMIHLAVHLPYEAQMCGPIQYRWMYPVERYLGTLKGMVRNRARPEGSIAEAYIVRESLTFCSLYFGDDVETRFNRLPRQYDIANVQENTLSVFSQRVRPLFASTYGAVDEETNAMHWFVLNNCTEVDPYMKEFTEELHARNIYNIAGVLRKEFPSWFKQRILNARATRLEDISDDLDALSWGPTLSTQIFQGCIVNGVRFITMGREVMHTTQNSGVSVGGAWDGKDMVFYGSLSRIIQLNYMGGRKTFLFHCKWYDLHHNKPECVDDDMWSINVGRSWYDNDPYIFADQASLVYYIQDPKRGGNWKVVQKMHPRHIFNSSLFETPEQDTNDVLPGDNLDPLQQDISNPVQVSDQWTDLGLLNRPRMVEDDD